MSRDPLRWIDAALEALERQTLRRRLTVSQPGLERRGRVQRDGRWLINFASNDYLGLAGLPLLSAVREALDASGWGSGASPLVTGRHPLHAELEHELARFEGSEAALLFPSGYAANVGAITALVAPGDDVFSDARNHASIIDGCRLSGANIHVYRHNDLEDLQSCLRQAAGGRRRLVVSDSLFSMDGDVAPLAGLVELAERYDAMLMLDEAHATGVFGLRGRGLAEAASVEDRVPIRVGTLSKALGSHGGFVAGSQSLIDWLANRARSYVFSTAAPPPLCAAGLAALQQISAHPEQREQLLKSAMQLRDRLKSQGWNVGASASQIVPLIVGDPAAAVGLSAKLAESGFLVPGIRPPSVPSGQALLRISLTAIHSPEDIESLVVALASHAPS